MTWEETAAKVAGGLGILAGAFYTVIRVLRSARSADAAATIQDKLLEQLHKAAEALQEENDALRNRLDEQDRALDGLRDRIEKMQDELFQVRGRAARAEALLRQNGIPVPRTPAGS